MFEEIINYDKWPVVEKINKGWSDDTKYYIETQGNQKLVYQFGLNLEVNSVNA